MKHLSRPQEDARAKLLDELRNAKAAVEETVAAVNSAIDEKVNGAIGNYNTALTALAEFRDDIVSQMEEYYDTRTESWQNGDAGSNYSSWKDEWEGVDLNEIDEVDFVETPDMNHDEDADALPSSAEGA